MSTSIDPKAVFFLPYAVTNIDGTMDLGCEGIEAYKTLDEAIEHAKDQTDKHGGFWYVYECKPVIRVRAYRTIVEKVGAIMPDSTDMDPTAFIELWENEQKAGIKSGRYILEGDRPAWCLVQKEHVQVTFEDGAFTCYPFDSFKEHYPQSRLPSEAIYAA
jgi:hypothetical protein